MYILFHQHHADILTANNSGDTPLDLAIQFNKQGTLLMSLRYLQAMSNLFFHPLIEAVAMLVDADPHSLKDSKIIINAAKTGEEHLVKKWA